MYTRDQKINIACILVIFALLIIFGLHHVLHFGIHIGPLFYEKMDDETYYADENYQFHISHESDGNTYSFVYPDRQFQVKFVWQGEGNVVIRFSDGITYQGKYDGGLLHNDETGMPLEWDTIFENDWEKMENIEIAEALCKVEHGKKEMEENGAMISFFVGLCIYISSTVSYIFPCFTIQILRHRRQLIEELEWEEPSEEEQQIMRKVAVTFLVAGGVLMLFARQIAGLIPME